jgi:hypothetical protein
MFNYYSNNLLQSKPLNVITDNVIIAAVFKQGVKTFFRVAKCFLRVVKVFQDCPITLDLIYGKVAFWGRGNFENI